MLATFAFDVCHDVYRAAREAIDEKIPTLNMESAGKYQWHPDRMPRLAEFVCDFARAGERALGGDVRGRGELAGRTVAGGSEGRRKHGDGGRFGEDSQIKIKCHDGESFGALSKVKRKQAEACSTCRAGLLVMFRVYYLGGAEYCSARRHMGISEITWGDWSEEIRLAVGKELMRTGVFPPARYFREITVARAS